MVIYPVPIEVTQARVQLVADQTAKARLTRHLFSPDLTTPCVSGDTRDRRPNSRRPRHQNRNRSPGRTTSMGS